VCIDTCVWVKFITGEDPAEILDRLSRSVMTALGSREIIGPAFLWAEVGSVLRKKVRLTQMTADAAQESWDSFAALPIRYLDGPEIRTHAWVIAERFGLATLYDAAFLACSEVADGSVDEPIEFWTVDSQLLRSLGASVPPYVRDLSIASTL
jgi:predicted nucleic acid-binding protein